MPTIDEHPLRYSQLADAIESVLFRRALDHTLLGYTLPTALEIADVVTKQFAATAYKTGEQHVRT